MADTPQFSEPRYERVDYTPETDSTKDQAKEVASHAGDRAKDVADTARDEAGVVKDTAAQAGAEVKETVKQQAENVASEAKFQSRRLLDEGAAELRTQAGAGQQQLAGLVRSLSGELKSMADSTNESGPMVDFVHRAEQLGNEAATWLESKQPDDVLAEVRRYAARNPWKFLAISAGVGFVGARIVRGLQGAKADQEDVAALTSDRGYEQVGTGYPADGYSDTTGTFTQPAGEPGLDQPYPTPQGGIGAEYPGTERPFEEGQRREEPWNQQGLR